MKIFKSINKAVVSSVFIIMLLMSGCGALYTSEKNQALRDYPKMATAGSMEASILMAGRSSLNSILQDYVTISAARSVGILFKKLKHFLSGISREF